MQETPTTIALVANGSIDDYEESAELIRAHKYIIAVDGGLNHLAKMNIKPDVIIGDLDSANKEFLELYSDVPIQRYPVDKDDTDLELAVGYALKQKPDKIYIYGALGKRPDHELATFHLLRRHPEKIIVETENEIIFAFDKPIIVDCSPGQTLSFIPLGIPPTGVTSQGLKWELHNATLDYRFMSISNVTVSDKFQIDIKTGDLLLIMGKIKMINAK